MLPTWRLSNGGGAYNVLGDNMKCPECNSDVVVERDCSDCGGFGTDLRDELCPKCEGDGSVKGEMECIDCGYEWDERTD